jgi:hypothetical protein
LTHRSPPEELFAAGVIGWDAHRQPVLPPHLRTGLIETTRWYAVVPTVFATHRLPPVPLKVEWEEFFPLQDADVQRLGWRQEAVISLDPEPPSDWQAVQAHRGLWGFLAHLRARLAGRVLPTAGQMALPEALAPFDPDAVLHAFVTAAQRMAKRTPRTHRV